MPPAPTLPSALEPVRFDDAAAAAFIDACRRAAAVLDEALAGRGRAAAVARKEWRGSFRHRFDDELAVLDGEAVDLVTDLRRAAATIGMARDAAHVENASRREARILWQRSQLTG